MRKIRRGLLTLPKSIIYWMNMKKVIKYCDKALAVDKTFKPALYEKVIVASCLKDMKMIDELTEDILSIPGNDLFSLLPIFIMNLFSKRYEKCLEIIDFANLTAPKGKKRSFSRVLSIKLSVKT